MPVLIFSKTADEVSVDTLLTKFFERLQIDCDGKAVSVLEFVAHVKEGSPLGLSKLDIIIPHVVSEIENVTGTFEDVNLVDNQVYSNGFEIIDANNKKYKIDELEVNLANLTSLPTIQATETYSVIRIKFDRIIPGNSGAFRLKMTIPKFANIYKSLGVFEISLYHGWTLSSHMEYVKEWEANGMPIDRKLCEMWVTLPKGTLCGKSIPSPQQIKMNHKYEILSNDLLETPRSAVYWDLEDHIFDLPGRSLGNLVEPGTGVRIYCETTRPHISTETFEEKMKATFDMMDNLNVSAIEAENSLSFIKRYGKQSFVITFFIGVLAIIISLLSLVY